MWHNGRMLDTYSILRHPDPRLRTRAKPVLVFDDRLKGITEKMLATMYAANGVGLAGTQVDIHERVVVMDVAAGNEPIVLINPTLVWKSDDLVEAPEGCLSVPQQRALVSRYRAVRVEYMDLSGGSASMDAEGLKAVCIQHEIDHLDGKVFVDYLSAMKKQRILTALAKTRRS